MQRFGLALAFVLVGSAAQAQVMVPVIEPYSAYGEPYRPVQLMPIYPELNRPQQQTLPPTPHPYDEMPIYRGRFKPFGQP